MKIKHIINNNHQLIETTINITKREIKVRYANSFLGLLWFIIYPLCLAAITTLIFSFIFKENINNTPYFLYVFIGFNSWSWFSQSIIQSTRSLVYNRELIINNKFPTESIIFGMNIARLPDFMVGLIFCYVVSIFSSQFTNFNGLLLILLITFLQLLFQVGLGLISSTINIFARDFQTIVEILLSLLFYATPIIYSINLTPKKLRKLIEINPMTQIITAYRNAFSNNHISCINLFIIFMIALITFMFGYILYKKFESRFAENL